MNQSLAEILGRLTKITSEKRAAGGTVAPTPKDPALVLSLIHI